MFRITCLKRLCVLALVSVALIIVYVSTHDFLTNLHQTSSHFKHLERSRNGDDIVVKGKTYRPTMPYNASRTARPWMTSNSLETNSSEKLYVFVVDAGIRRLGNQLFNYASLFGIAWMNNRTPLWSMPSGSHTNLITYFNISMPIDNESGIIKNQGSHFKHVMESGSMVYNATKRLPNANVSLTTFLQSWRYFSDVEDQLRDDLTFREDIVRKAEAFLRDSIPQAWTNKTCMRVVIHVRRTDYTKPAFRDEGWTSPEPDYFQRAMMFFRRLFKRVLFVVLSDDIRWCRQHIVGEHIVYSEGRRPIEDLAIASLCDHAIITIGSFSWWTAWFANGITITQANFPPHNSIVTHRMNRKDFYKPEWVSL